VLALPLFLVLSSVLSRMLFAKAANSHTDFIFAVSKSELRIALLGPVLLLMIAAVLLWRRSRL
jgi:cell division protein FtsW (lipid II flippase)